MSFDEFIRNPLVSLFGGAFLSAVIAIIIYQVTKQKKLPAFNYSTRKLISNYKSEFEGLTVKYNNKHIESLYATKIILWNEGKSSICSNDISINDPIKFNIGGKATILDYGIIGKSDDSIIPNLTVSEDVKSLIINFDHLNYKDGIAIQVLHTDNYDDFNVSGTLKCYKGKIIKSKNLFSLNSDFFRDFLLVIASISSIMTAIITSLVDDNMMTKKAGTPTIIVFATGIFLILIGMTLCFWKKSKIRIPKELKKYV